MKIDDTCLSPSPPALSPSTNSMPTNFPLCPTSIPLSYGQYHQSAPPLVNNLGGWIFNPSMQTIPQIFHPMLNPHQQYGKISFSLFNILIKENLSSSF